MNSRVEIISFGRIAQYFFFFFFGLNQFNCKISYKWARFYEVNLNLETPESFQNFP